MVKVDLDDAHLTLTHGRAVLVIPTDPFSKFAYEAVSAPDGTIVHEASFLKQSLGTQNLQVYIEALENTKRRAS